MRMKSYTHNTMPYTIILFVVFMYDFRAIGARFDDLKANLRRSSKSVRAVISRRQNWFFSASLPNTGISIPLCNFCEIGNLFQREK